MTAWEKAFESEKNRKAITYTAIVLGILLLMFFLMGILLLMFFLISWKNQPPTPPIVEDLIEINLGNNEEGWGEEQPLIKGEMSPNQQATVVPQQQAKAPDEAEEPITADDNAEESAAPVTKTVKATPKVTKLPNHLLPQLRLHLLLSHKNQRLLTMVLAMEMATMPQKTMAIECKAIIKMAKAMAARQQAARQQATPILMAIRPGEKLQVAH